MQTILPCSFIQHSLPVTLFFFFFQTLNILGRQTVLTNETILLHKHPYLAHVLEDLPAYLAFSPETHCCPKTVI